MNNILIIEDDEHIRKFLRIALEEENFYVFEASNAKRGLIEASSRQPNLIILDLGLPDMDGKQLIKEIRQWSEVAIIVLSARNDETEKVKALDIGADDYLIKPFGIPELLARIKAQLRRLNYNSSNTESIVRFSDVIINLTTHEITKNNQLIHLTPIEYRLLVALIKGKDKVLTHRHLILEVWGASYIDRPHYLRIYMSNLRQKLEDNPNLPQHFLTELQVGYRLKGIE